MAPTVFELLFPHFKNGSTVSVYVVGGCTVSSCPDSLLGRLWASGVPQAHLPTSTAQPLLPTQFSEKAGNGSFPCAGCPGTPSAGNGVCQAGWSSFEWFLESAPKPKVTQQSRGTGESLGQLLDPELRRGGGPLNPLPDSPSPTNKSRCLNFRH